jgi:hypothetical protein
MNPGHKYTNSNEIHQAYNTQNIHFGITPSSHYPFKA